MKTHNLKVSDNKENKQVNTFNAVACLWPFEWSFK